MSKKVSDFLELKGKRGITKLPETKPTFTRHVLAHFLCWGQLGKLLGSPRKNVPKNAPAAAVSPKMAAVSYRAAAISYTAAAVSIRWPPDARSPCQ